MEGMELLDYQEEESFQGLREELLEHRMEAAASLLLVRRFKHCRMHLVLTWKAW